MFVGFIGSIGLLVYWFIGSLVYWFLLCSYSALTQLLNCYNYGLTWFCWVLVFFFGSIGLLVGWFVGLLVYWFISVLVY